MLDSHISKPASLSWIPKSANAILRTTALRMLSNCSNFSHYYSAHPKSLKDSIPFSQGLCIKRICTETSEVIRHFKNLKDAFIKQSYKPELLDYHLREQCMQIKKHFYKPRKRQLPRKVYHQWLLSTKHYQISKMLLIKTGKLFLLMNN